MTEQPQAQASDNPNALGQMDNPAGQVPLQPVPWSYEVLPVKLEGQGPTVLLSIFTPNGRTMLFVPADFGIEVASTLARVCVMTKEISGDLVTPPKPQLIVPRT